MRHISYIGLVALILSCTHVFAQAPQGINYQGVARGLDGQPISQKEITIRISILNGSADGELEYDEIHEVKTNSFGLFTLVIGEGEQGTSDFSFIGWTSGKKFLQIEMDENGGRNFKLMGSQQLMSVPYALYAERSGNGYQAGQGINISNNMISNAGDGDNDATNELISSVALGVDNKLRITDAGGTKETDLSGLLGASQNLSNVLTEGSSAGNSTITDLAAPVNASDAATKAYVDAYTDGDADAINEIQNLTQVLAEGNDAGGSKITNLGAPITNSDAATKAYVDSHNDGDADATNEIQNLAEVLAQSNDAGGTKITNLSDPTIAADAATMAYVDAHTDGDASPSNEIQDLSLAGNTLSLSGDATTVSLAPYLDNTDNQNLSNVLGIGNSAGGLKIENLGVPTINTDAATKAYVDAHIDGDASPTNELQNLSSSASGVDRTINISGGTGTTIDVADNDNSATNESQSLSRTGSNLTLSQVSGTGGGVVSIDDADANPINEAQTLTKTGTAVSLTNVSGSGGGSFVINDDSGTNEAQTLTKTGATVTLSNVIGVGGGSVLLNDDSNTNEAQTISRVGSTVTLAQANGAGGGIFSIDDADANSTNEAQGISRVGSTVTMTPVGATGGGSFSVNDNDADPINEIQNLDQVLTVNNSAGTKAISNLADPSNTQDAATKNYVDLADNALSARIANNYAFKVNYDHTHSAPTTQVVTIVSEEFDDFMLVTSNTFVSPENGIYQFTVSGISPLGGIPLQIRFTPISGPVKLIDIKRQIGYPNSMIINYFDSTILKMNAGDIVELIVSSGIINEVVTGTFSGFKL